ncbi:MAG: alpha/beta hydrolase [Novosphingobium sp.]|nr:alpha/beta hydrolase [Novosphingobium sp.]
MSRLLTVIVAAGLGCAATLAGAQDSAAPAKPEFREDGTVVVPSFELPPSVFSSKEAQAMQAMRAKMAGMMPAEMPADIEANRRQIDAMLAPQLKLMRSMYDVEISEHDLAGVQVRLVKPKDGNYDRDRVLINLHGGAFSICWESCSLLESIPIAALGDFEVISVNYRMAPENRHPAGVEDVAKVYAELLKYHEPDHIGIYGCSAGGALTAQTGAWLPAHGLPQAGALGIFGAGGVRFREGDSAYVAAYIDGSFPPPPPEGEEGFDMTWGYFAGVDMSGADVSPGLHQDVLKKFPPTLLITGTRAMDMSPAIYTNSMLMKAGVETDLIVGEGMGHCYIMMPTLPEAQDAYAAIVSFFKQHLK